MDENKKQDERFAKVYQDPRFRTIRKKDKTLKIDKRFKSMFTEDKFTLKYCMDKRGRSRKHLIAEDYTKFYRLDENNCKREKKKVGSKTNDSFYETVDGKGLYDENNQDNKIENEDDENKESEEYEQRDIKLTHKFGYHRGFNFKSDDEDDKKSSNSSSSSSSSSESEDDEDEEELEHNWGELDKDAQKIDHATSRIAICNADWDQINSQDLYVLLNSFKPSTSTIYSVRIYYSKFGEERLKTEEEKGPSEFIFGKAQIETNINGENKSQITSKFNYKNEIEDNDDVKIGDHNTVEKLRKYQLERLKYFYAVVECDTVETAEIIYNELDGLEYESSSTMLDIRFIPENMDFDDVQLKEECTLMPISSTYKAPSFTNTALQQSNVRITWDETDPKRKDTFNKAFEEDNENDIKAYLATSSSEDEEFENKKIEISEDMKDSDKINKYKDLISSLDKENEKRDYDLEVTWEPKLKSNTKNLLTKRTDSLTFSKETNLEDDVESHDHLYLADKEQYVSNAEESLIEEKSPSKDKKKSKFEHNTNKLNQTNEDPSNIELLMMDMDNMDSSNTRKHFNYKDIIEKFKKNEKYEDDGFKFDPDDVRFNSIYDSHLYNIDQSDPNFKRTKAFEEILKKQKQKARTLIKDEKFYQGTQQMGIHQKTITKVNDRKTLNTLVNKIKNKTKEQFDEKVRKQISSNEKNARFNTNKKFRC